MDVGVGLPAAVPGVRGPELLDWARRADRCGFSALGVLDRLVYDNCEPLVTLAAAAAVTHRIRLVATVLVAPCRANSALLAKQAATVDTLSGGRLVVGVSAGGREDDFAASGVPYAGRGRRLDDMLERILRIWAGDGQGGAYRVGPTLPRRPPLLIGGHSDAAMRRAATYGQGWVAGAGSVTAYPELLRRAQSAWRAAGRTGEPRMVALAYFALGYGARDAAERYLSDYYAFLGSKATLAAAGALTDEARLADAMREHEEAGCDEFILFPCHADPGQVDLLAAAAFR